MEPNQNQQPENIPLPVTEIGKDQNGAEAFRKVPNDAEVFGTVRNNAERFGHIPHASERKENHSLTVREAARLFEAASVARTERSITNWCQPNRTGVARLDAYFDPNERKYYISPQSVELAIAEEKAKAAKINEPLEAFAKMPEPSEAFRTIPHDAEATNIAESATSAENFRVKELEQENLDLKIMNKGKDFYIEQLKNERTDFFEQVVSANRKVGELETKLLQLGTHKENLM